MGTKTTKDIEGVWEKVRSECLARPGSVEVMAYGHPNIKAGKRMVVALENYGGRPSIAFRVARDLQQQLLEDRRYFVPKFGAKEGWICISVQEGVTQREIDSLIEAAYSAADDAAPKRAATAPRARKAKATSTRRKTR